MKYLVVLCDGFTDQPIAEKDNQTPLQQAQTPHLDRLVQMGRSGSVHPVPESMHAGADVAYLSYLGLDPEKYYASPAWFEAEALSLSIEDGWAPLCCDLATLQASHNDMVMKDYTAGYISDPSARTLLAALQEQIVDVDVRFHFGRGYHNLLEIKGPPFPGRLNPPNELIGEGVRKYLPTQDDYKSLIFLINQAQIILHNHPLNKTRKAEGKDSANTVWLWGNGAKPDLPDFSERTGRSAAVVSGSLLFRGMAKLSGMDAPEIEGANGLANTNFEAKREAALEELEKRDVVYLHFAGAEDLSLHGNFDEKVLMLEDFDQDVMGPLLDRLEDRKDVKMLFAGGHFSSVALMKISRDAVPFIAYPSAQGPDEMEKFDEDVVASGPAPFKNGPDLLDAFLKDQL